MAYKSKEARNEYARKWYQNNAKKHCERVAATRDRRRQDCREWFQAYKSTLKCKLCPENHPATLDFHHRNGDKEFEVSNGVVQGQSKERILKEIEKCDILCSNCHRKLHSELNGLRCSD